MELVRDAVALEHLRESFVLPNIDDPIGVAVMQLIWRTDSLHCRRRGRRGLADENEFLALERDRLPRHFS